MKNKFYKYISILLAIMFIIVSLGLLHIVHSKVHTHQHDDCSICKLIAILKDMPYISIYAISIILLNINKKFVLRVLFKYFINITPVSLKVLLLN